MIKVIKKYIGTPAECPYRVVIPWYPSEHPHYRSVCSFKGNTCKCGDKFLKECPLEDAE